WRISQSPRMLCLQKHDKAVNSQPPVAIAAVGIDALQKVGKTEAFAAQSYAQRTLIVCAQHMRQSAQLFIAQYFGKVSQQLTGGFKYRSGDGDAHEFVDDKWRLTRMLP